jgi:hypothetical protein
LSASGSSARTPIQLEDHESGHTQCSCSKFSAHKPYVSRDSSSGGKIPLHGPRRIIKPSTLFGGDFETTKANIIVSNSEKKNYEALCSLASSKFSKYVFFLTYLI